MLMPESLPPAGSSAAGPLPDDLLLALEHIGDGFYVVDNHWTIKFFNARAERHFGLRRDRVLGRSLWEVFPAAVGTAFEQAFRRAMQLRQQVRVESPSVLGNGCWVEVEASPYEHGLSVRFNDVTARKQAEERLQEREARLGLILAAAELHTWTLHVPSSTIDAEPEAWTLHGLPAAAVPVAAAQILRHVDPDDVTQIRTRLAGALAGGPDYDATYRIVLPGGQQRWVRSAGRLVRDAHGRPASLLVGACKDITVAKQAEQALRASEERLRVVVEQLQEADRRKDEFLAMLAHELRNPLAPLTNALRLLERSGEGAQTSRAALMLADRQTRQLARLVDDLLEVSRITSGRIELRRQPMMIDAAVRDAVDSAASMVEARQQRLEVRLPPRPVELRADPARIAQVLENLLHNASKYTQVGGAIRIEVVEQPHEIEVRVADNGIGIDADQLPRLFQLFTQIETTLDRSQGGLGIGLALVKRLVELHGGSVAAASAGRGQGATFTVRLPRQPALAA